MNDREMSAAAKRFSELHRHERMHFPHVVTTFGEECDIALSASLQQILEQYRAERVWDGDVDHFQG
jgi:hypothetical protein